MAVPGLLFGFLVLRAPVRDSAVREVTVFPDVAARITARASSPFPATLQADEVDVHESTEPRSFARFGPRSRLSGNAVSKPGEGSGKPWTRKGRRFQVTLGPLAAARDGLADAIRFDMGDSRSIDGEVERRVIRSNRSYTMRGRLRGERFGSFVVSVERDVVMANVRSEKGGHWQIRYAGNGFHEWRVFDEDLAPGCGMGSRGVAMGRSHPPGNRPPGAGSKVPLLREKTAAFDPDGGVVAEGAESEGGVANDDLTYCDVLIVYTAQVKTLVGGETAMTALMHLGIDEANAAYENSGVLMRLNLVHSAEMTDVEGPSMSYDLTRLTNPYDGWMDEAHEMRELYYADIVSLWGDYSDYCGIANLMTTLSVDFASLAVNICEYTCATGNLTFAHEMGHNMGCHHAVGDAGNAQGSGLFDYSHGWRWYVNAGQSYRSVMAYAPGSRVPFFSNPEVDYLGLPTGQTVGAPDEASNALSLNSARHVIADWRIMPPPSLEFSEVSVRRTIVLGATASEQPLKVRNVGGGQIDYEIQCSAGWLPVSPPAGAVTYPYETGHMMTFATEGLTAGVYSETVSVSGTGAGNSPVTIPVSIRVFDPTVTQTMEFNSSGPLALGQAQYQKGPADPYPSSISVSGMSGRILDIVVKIDGVFHERSQDIDVVLKGPGGRAVMLMSDVGGYGPISGADLAFVTSWNGPAESIPTQDTVYSGAYFPTDFKVTDYLWPPAPAPPYGVALDDFIGEIANGDWELYVMDDYHERTGSIDGWRIELTTASGSVSYEAWATAYFGGPVAPWSGQEEDPDCDGVTNFCEFALGLDPWNDSSAALPRMIAEPGSQEGEEGSWYLGLAVTRSLAMPGVNYLVEVSSDLENWSSGAGNTTTFMETPTQLIVCDTLPVGALPQRYFRLRLEPSGP